MDIKVFTEKEYYKVRRLYPNFGKINSLKEKEEEYYLETEDEYEVHNEHDKIFKKILEKPKEAEFIIKKVLNLDRNKKLDIISVRNEYVTVDFRGKQVDMLYKLKDREVYFVIEHQSTQDNEMPYRILEYETEIMRRCFIENEFKNRLHAKVIAIVIYTGPGKWKQPQSIVEIQEKFGYKVNPNENYSGLGEYNILSIDECANKELLEEGTFISKAMLIEKVRGEEELIDVLEKIIPMIKDNEKADMITILRYILMKDLGKEKAKEYIKILEGGIDMSGFVNTLREDRERTIKKARKEGKEEGKIEGREEASKEAKIEESFRVAKSMVKEKIDISIVEKITGLKRNQFM